jgi:hypothetical protein
LSSARETLSAECCVMSAILLTAESAKGAIRLTTDHS